MAATRSKQELALNRLSSRLTSMRATLRKDERILLDELVCSASISLGADAEVAGHAMVTSGEAAATAISFTLVNGKYCAIAK